LSASTILASVYLCDGRLIYTLDDPYIHMKVAQTILRGGYGINFSEYASPSSSMLWPLMVAGTDLLGLGSAGPLILNLAAAAGAVHMGSLLVERHVLGGLVTRKTALLAFPLGVLLIFALSALAFPMTGLEHSWHVFLVVVVLFGLAEMMTGHGVVSWGVVAAIVLIPLIRFEGIAFSGAAILGRWMPTLIASALIVAAFSIYGAEMQRLGLPLMPASVLLKSQVVASAVDAQGGFVNSAGHVVKSIYDNLLGFLANPQGVLLLLMSLIMLGAWALTPAGPDRRSTAVVGGVATLGLFAHFVGGGHYGWTGRHEVYAIASGLLATLFTLRIWIQEAVARHAWKAQAVLLLAVAILVGPYMRLAIETPFASRGIYERQFQMHRFATDFYKEPVAVNDVGWVSYNNDAFVLDLWGLGSEPVRRLKMTQGFGSGGG
jgi:hypothetical protein